LDGLTPTSITLELILSILAVFAAALAVFLGGPLLRRSWRQRAGWIPLELIGPFAAFALWFLLATRPYPVKSLSNAAMEPILLALAVGLLAVGRLAVGSRTSVTRLRITFHSMSLLAAFCLWYLIPTLPE
jgi:hypothetical protein